MTKSATQKAQEKYEKLVTEEAKWRHSAADPRGEASSPCILRLDPREPAYYTPPLDYRFTWRP